MGFLSSLLPSFFIPSVSCLVLSSSFVSHIPIPTFLYSHTSIILYLPCLPPAPPIITTLPSFPPFLPILPYSFSRELTYSHYFPYIACSHTALPPFLVFLPVLPVLPHYLPYTHIPILHCPILPFFHFFFDLRFFLPSFPFSFLPSFLPSFLDLFCSFIDLFLLLR